MSDDRDDAAVAAAIRGYREELVAEADLARSDLDEIEDHLRTLTDELRTTGMPVAAAVTEAARRLGDPRDVAREHARARSPFGAKISRGRAWSAAALYAPMVVCVAIVRFTGLGFREVSPYIHLGMGSVLVVALVARLTWARPVLFGAMACQAVVACAWLVGVPDVNPLSLVWTLGTLGVVAFLLPWRRGELTGAGSSLLLQVWSFCAVSSLVLPTLAIALAVPLLVAMLAAIVAIAGQILRARWSAFASAMAAVMLTFSFVEAWSLTPFAPDMFGADLWRGLNLALLGSGAIAAAVSAVLSWRTARSNLGTFANVLR